MTTTPAATGVSEARSIASRLAGPAGGALLAAPVAWAGFASGPSVVPVTTGAAVAGLALWAALRRRDRWHLMPSGPWVLLLLVLGAIAIERSGCAEVSRVRGLQWVGYAAVHLLGLQVAARSRARDVAAALTLASLAIGLSPWVVGGAAGTPGLAPVPFENPNQFAAFLGLGLWTAVGLAAASRGGRRVLGAAVAVFLLGLLAQTGSRGGLVGLGVSGCVVAWFRTAGLRIRGVSVRWILGVVVTAGVGIAVLGFRGGGVLEGSERNRLDIWVLAGESVAAHPVWGTGPATFREVFLSHQELVDVRRFAHHAHSDVVELAAEAGGAILLVAVFAVLACGVSWVRAWEASSGEGATTRWIALGAAAGATGFLVHALFDSHLRLMPLGATFAAVSALALRPLARTRTRKAAGPRVALVFVPVLVLGLLLPLLLRTGLVGTGLREATALRRAGDAGGARRALDGVLRRAPRHPEALALEATLATSLALETDDPSARRERFVEAARAWAAAEAACPLRFDLPSSSATTLELMGRSDEAVAALERALAKAPALGAPWFALGRLRLRRGEVRDAILPLRRAIELDPALLPLVVRELVSRGVRGSRIREILPRDLDRLRDLARVLAEEGAMQEAAAARTVAWETWGEVEDGLALARVLGEVDPAAADRHVADLLERHPDDARVLGVAARRAAASLDPERAVELQRRIVALEPDSADHWQVLGRYLHEAERCEEFLEELPSAVRSAGLLFETARCREAVGDRRGALRDRIDAVAEDPERAAFRLELALQLERMGMFGRARDEAIFCLELAPDQPGCQAVVRRTSRRLR